MDFYFSLPVKVKGSPAPTLQWYHNGVELQQKPRYRITVDTDNGESTLEITSVTYEDTGAYQLVAENHSGRATTTCVINLSSEYLEVLQFKNKKFVLL